MSPAGILARRHFLIEDARQFEPPGETAATCARQAFSISTIGRKLGSRRRRLTVFAQLPVDAGRRRDTPQHFGQVLGLLADQGDIEGALVLDQRACRADRAGSRAAPAAAAAQCGCSRRSRGTSRAARSGRPRRRRRSPQTPPRSRTAHAEPECQAAAIVRHQVGGAIVRTASSDCPAAPSGGAAGAGPCSTIKAATIPSSPLARAWISVADNGIANGRPPIKACSPSNTTWWTTVAATNITSRGTVVDRLNCAPRTPTRKPDQRLRHPADADDAAGERVLREAAEHARRAAPSPRRTTATGDHRDQHQVDGDRPAGQHARQRRLQCQRADDARGCPRRSSLRRLVGRRRPRRRQHDEHFLEAREVHARAGR